MHRWAERLVPAAALLLCAAPLFVLTVNGWSSGILFLAALLSCAMLAGGGLPRAELAPPERRWARAMVVVLVAPLASVLFAAALRGDTYLPQFDAAARLLLGIPILLLVVRLRIDAATRLVWVLPVSLAITLAWRLVEGQPPNWPATRMTASFTDPLVFGYVSLAFAMMCLVSIAPGDWRPGNRWSVLLRVVGVLLGLYLSVRSSSRTGWLALPVVVGLWLHVHWGRRHRAAAAAALVLAVLAAVGAYLLLPTVHQRVTLGFREVLDYSWSGVAPHTSVALRITFLRIAADLVMLHPWAGVGDTAHAAPAAANSFSYASPDAVRIAFGAAFHNQIVTNTVRSGIGGLLATTVLLLAPLVLCARRIARADAGHCRNALMGFAFFTTFFVSSMSTEVVDLKYMASFYAVMTAVLCGATLARRDAAKSFTAS